METKDKTEETATPKKRKKAPFILGGLLLIGGIYATRTYIWNRHHETTEDAQLEGNIAPVLARVSGYVTDIRFEDNQMVHKGDTLVILDDRDLQIKVLQAEAALKNAEANVDVVKSGTGTAAAGVATAKSNVELANVAMTSAKTDLDRYTALLKEKSVTQAQFEQIKTVYDGAVSTVNVAKKQYEAALATSSAATEQIAVANSLVDQRKADLDYAKLQLSYAVITATMDGEVSKKSIQPGQYVTAGQALFSIVDENSIWVVANFKETQLTQMQVGQTVEVKVDAYSDTPLAGEVASFSGATGARFALLPPDNSTGNFVKVVQRVPVKILIKADKSTIQKLRPGMSVSVVVNIDDKGK